MISEDRLIAKLIDLTRENAILRMSNKAITHQEASKLTCPYGHSCYGNKCMMWKKINDIQGKCALKIHL